MSIIYGFKFKRIAYICKTFAAVLQVSLNENNNQSKLKKYFRAWQSHPYQNKSQGQRSESKRIIEYYNLVQCVYKI